VLSLACDGNRSNVGLSNIGRSVDARPQCPRPTPVSRATHSRNYWPGA
jgi:hypothetical protein